MNEKVAGYAMLGIGILIILYSAWSVFAVFTKRTAPVQLFNFSGISLDPSTLLGGEGASLQQQQLSSSQTQNANVELIPPGLLNDTSNIFAHLFLMGFIGGVGHKVASLGVMLVRPVEVKVRTKEIPVDK